MREILGKEIPNPVIDLEQEDRKRREVTCEARVEKGAIAMVGRRGERSFVIEGQKFAMGENIILVG